MMEARLLAIILLSLIVTFPKEVDLTYVSDETNATSTSYHVVQQWAEKLSFELYNLGDYITRRKQVQEKFKEAQVVSRFGQKIVEDMAKEIKDMMDWKVGTVQKIVEAAQNIAIYNEEEADTSFRYFNAKEMLEPHDKPYVPRKLELVEIEPLIKKPPPKIIELVPHPNFPGLPVNFTYSSVHVPTNVFDRSLGVIKAIQWSEQLDEVFRSNHRDDPTLSWQFFGSSHGFMRQYPASKWKEDPVDLYDCRLRQWYINGANSPKDVIILVDNSGSMTGETKIIAKHVASTILDTLGSNDFVNILTFSDDIKDVVSCVGDSLVPATMGNLRELKLGLEKINTTEMANFTLILSKAFDILEEYRTDRQGARCNQAIMLISDGVPYKYEEVFEEYNWQNLPIMPVRVFTYLVGSEVADVSQIKWMACENQGFYVHLSTTADVREDVLNYLHVMARPLALKQNDHPITWTDVYADAEDPKMTDWLWRNKEFEMQKERFVSMQNNSKINVSQDEQNRRSGQKNKKVHTHKYNEEKYILMTTVSMPVFDLRENASRIAKLLGVAGTDVPVSDINMLMRPYMLGVNGYSFIVTNNGYILTHPDLRPVFQKILKPSYNSVDMVEIEQMDDDSEPRAFNPVIMDIRDKIINQTTSSKWMIMKYHMDDMKRVSKLKRQYFWTGIKDTPFTLVITYPHEYGVNRIQIKSDEDEIQRLYVRGGNSIKYFQGQRWRVHPDWLYCKNRTAQFKTPEEELLHFLREISASGWKWPLNRSRPPSVIYCDRGLLQLLVFDARVTEFFSNFSAREDRKISSPIAVIMGLLPRFEFKKRFGVTTAFIATHSGLTRWVDINSNTANQTNREFNFTESNGRAIDEVWYKRAVDQHFIEPDSFVYSVPFDSGYNTETLVTASHAVFHTDDERSAPVAVVGFNFHHKALSKIFKNITSSCPEANCKTCDSNELECYVLDNHGYVIIGSENSTGQFYGDVNNSVMHLLVEEKVYKKVKIYDYQGVCFAGKKYANRVNTAFNTLFEFYNKVSINKTRPETCDQEITLYQLDTDKDTTIYITPASRERPFTVLPIKQSNMILLVVDVLNVIANQSVPVTTRPFDINYEESLMCHKIFSAMPRKRPTSCTNKHFNENSIKFCGQGFIKTFSLALIIFAICFIQLF